MKSLEKKGKVLLARALAPILGTRGKSVPTPEPSSVRRLLVIRQHNQMGDMLLAVPALRGIRKRYPNARIALLAAPINTDVMLNNPYIDEVLTWSKRTSGKNPAALAGFIAGLRKRRFDVVIVLNTVSFSVTSMLLAAASGAVWRAGSSSSSFGSDLTSRYYHLELPLPGADELSRMHESEHNLYPLAALGIAEDDLSSLLVPFDWEERSCRDFISAAFGAAAAYAVIHPGAGKAQNVWPPERFAEVSSRLRDDFGLETAAVRGPVDGASFERFLEACEAPPQVVSCPTVGFLGAMMRGAAVTVCNDTGIAHIAGAVGARCVEIFGPTDPGRWKPVSGSVAALRADDGLVESVSTDDVLLKVRELLGE